jgi:glutamine synthetase
VAESLDFVATRLEGAVKKGKDLNAAIQSLLSEMIREFKPVLFDGDNYSDAWKQEAHRRGLPDLQSTLECVPLVDSPETIALFTKYGVYTERELHSRKEIMLETYVRTVRIEGLTASVMAHTMILPAALKYQADVASAINSAAAAGVKEAVQMDLLRELASAVSACRSAAVALDKALSHHGNGDAMDHARHCRQVVLPAMAELRKWADTLELLVNDEYWPLPTYREMLFIR